MFGIWQILETHQTGLQPFFIRMFASKLFFDFRVFDDAMFAQIDEEHFAWFQATFANNSVWLDV